MHFLLLLFLSLKTFATTELAQDWIEENPSHKTDSRQVSDSFTDILAAQGRALEAMGKPLPGQKSPPFGFKLTELITDIAVSKKGFLGLSALKANNGVEIKWKRTAPQVPQDKLRDQIEEEKIDFTVDHTATLQDLNSLTESIATMVEASGKVEKTGKVRRRVWDALTAVRDDVSSMSVTRVRSWKVSNLRLDLNFSTSGKLSFFTKAGVALRIRIEWRLSERPLVNPEEALSTPQTRFIVKALSELDETLGQVPLRGFEVKKVSLGVGSAVKKKFFGLWKQSLGFVGFLSFVPVAQASDKAQARVQIPAGLKQQKLDLDGSPVDFAAGMRKSVRTAAFFTERASRLSFKTWEIAELKSVHDITKTGFFGLSDVSTKGVVEIDFKRRTP